MPSEADWAVATAGRDRAGPLGWAELAAELECWAEAGRTALFWWRDDDATDTPPALDRLLSLGQEHGIGLALAAVPAGATEGLADAVARFPTVAVVQHGYAHRNHAAPGEPAVEIGGERPVAAILAELQAGFDRLGALFGPRFQPILAAPWNRISPLVIPELPGAGYSGLSTFGQRGARQPVPGLTAVNTHVDPLRWRGGPRFGGTERVLAQLIGELRDRRTGRLDPDEPLGLLTHHRDHDEPAWAFLEMLFRLTSEHPAARWLAATEPFAPVASPRVARVP